MGLVGEGWPSVWLLIAALIAPFPVVSFAQSLLAAQIPMRSTHFYNHWFASGSVYTRE